MPGGEGLSFYNARWYDAQLGRFVSADTIVPDLINPQDLNRHSYVRNNPLNYEDPTGNSPTGPMFDPNGSGGGALLYRWAAGVARVVTTVGGTTALVRVTNVANRITNSNGLKQLRIFFNTGIPKGFQRAMGQALNEGDYFSVRGFRPRSAIITENFIGPKTEVMSKSNPQKWVIDFFGKKVDTGIRVGQDGVKELSDIDIGWVYNGARGQFLSEQEFRPIQNLVNKVLYPTLQGNGIMTHGDQYNGLMKPNTALTVDHLSELTHVFKVVNGQAIYQYSAPWRDTVFRMLEHMSRQGPTIAP